MESVPHPLLKCQGWDLCSQKAAGLGAKEKTNWAPNLAILVPLTQCSQRSHLGILEPSGWAVYRAPWQ